MKKKRMYNILWNAIKSFEDEADERDYENVGGIHNYTLIKFDISEREYRKIWNKHYEERNKRMAVNMLNDQ